MKRFICLFCYFILLFAVHAAAQKVAVFKGGHSHNDYQQTQPLYTAYQSGMGSIEADVFLKNGQLYVAHDSTEIKIGATLKKLYLEPLARLYAQNDNHVFLDTSKSMQLVVDIKEAHPLVLAQLIKELKVFGNTFDKVKNPQAISIVVSGDLPASAAFKKYPRYFSFDGRPNLVYSDKQLRRVAMISADFKKFSKWKGVGEISAADEIILKSVVNEAHEKGKPFRFWGTPDRENSWKLMENIGADWINTDVPRQLQRYFLQ